MNTVKRVYLDEVSTEIQDVRTSIATLVEKLSGYLEEIGVEDKARKAKMKDKSSAFVQKAYDYSKLHSFMIPPFVNMEEYYKNVEAMELYRQLLDPLRILVKGLEDTSFMISCDIYEVARLMYKESKTAAENNYPGAQMVYDDLKIRFESQGNWRKKTDPTKEEK